MAARPELDAEKWMREFVQRTYDELQRDVAKATMERERQEKEYGDFLREEMAYVCDPLRPGRLRAESLAASEQCHLNRKGPTPAERALLPPQYPGMTQINQIPGGNISGTRVPATRAPADPRRMHFPSRDIPEATGTPPETPHAEAGPSSRDTALVGHTQQPSDRLVEPRPADDGVVPILTTRTRSRSTARICTTADSSTSMTGISTEKEINVPGSGLRFTVSQTKQRLEATDARGLHVAHEEEETVVRKMLVPGGRIGAPSLLGVVRGVARTERRQAPGEVKEGAARVKPREQAVVPGQRLVRQVIQQASRPAPSHPILKRGQEFVPRPPPVMVVRDDARERVLSRTQVGSVSEELEAAYTHVTECNDCSRYLNPLLRKVGVKLVNLPCAASNGRQLQLAAGKARATESDWSEEGRSDADALSTTTRRAVESASCRLLCWDVEGLSEDAAGTPATPEPLVIRPRDESCSPICWEMLAPTIDKRAPERQPDARPPAPRPGVPPPKPAARELRAAPQHAPKRQLDNRPPTLRSATPPPQPVARELRAEPQERRLHCCPPCNAKATGAAQGRFQEQRGVQPWLPTMGKEFRRMEQLRAPRTDPRFVSDPQQPRMSPAKPRYETIDQATWAAPAQPPRVQRPSAVQQKKNFRFQTGPVDLRPDARSIHMMVNAAWPVAQVPVVPLQQETDGPRDAARPVARVPLVPPQQGQDFWCCEDCNCTVMEDNGPDALRQTVRRPMVPQTQEASHKDASRRTPVSTPKEEDDECILEPYVERFHFTNEELAKAFPREARAVVPSAAPPICCPHECLSRGGGVTCDTETREHCRRQCAAQNVACQAALQDQEPIFTVAKDRNF